MRRLCEPLSSSSEMKEAVKNLFESCCSRVEQTKEKRSIEEKWYGGRLKNKQDSGGRVKGLKHRNYSVVAYYLPKGATMILAIGTRWSNQLGENLA